MSRASMSHGVTARTTYSIQMILYEMEGTVFPAANFAHNIIHRILLSNCQPQPLMTLRPGSVGITDSNTSKASWAVCAVISSTCVYTVRKINLCNVTYSTAAYSKVVNNICVDTRLIMLNQMCIIVMNSIYLAEETH